MLTYDEVLREAALTGFQIDPFEKVGRLLELLEAMARHPFLKGRLALKGGTAINLFLFDVPRLSVDVDLNYIGAADRETMLAERPKLEQALEAACGRLGLQVRRAPSDHAGGKWRLSFSSASGRPATLEVDLNYLLRTPLWPPTDVDSRPVGSLDSVRVGVLETHEIAAGKLGALFARRASRDLFDSVGLLRDAGLDPHRLRLAFVVYGGTNRRDWRSVSVDDISADVLEVERRLVPVLRGPSAPSRSDLARWIDQLVTECRELVSGLLPMTANEIEFLSRLNDRGEIAPDLLTGDGTMRSIILSHPALQWKAMNVRGHVSRHQESTR